MTRDDLRFLNVLLFLLEQLGTFLLSVHILHFATREVWVGRVGWFGVGSWYMDATPMEHAQLKILLHALFLRHFPPSIRSLQIKSGFCDFLW